VRSKPPFQIVAVALFAVMVLPSSAAILYGYSSPCQPMPPACRAHNHPLPAEKTRTHECCVTGQAPALPTVLTRLDCSYCFTPVVPEQLSLAIDLREPMVVLPYRSETPPGTSPLRI
jgi:hypothetical protein